MNQSNSRKTEMKKTPKKIVLLMRRMCGFTERVDELYQTRPAWNSCGGHIGLLDTHWISFLVAMTLIWFSSFLGYHTHLSLPWLCWQIPQYHYLALSLHPGWVVSCNRGEEKNNRIAVKGTERNREINTGGRSVAFLKTISCSISTCALCSWIAF